MLLIECDPEQARRIEDMALEAWPAANVSVHKDLSGHPRVVEVRVP
jgi:hypothetical protein